MLFGAPVVVLGCGRTHAAPSCPRVLAAVAVGTQSERGTAMKHEPQGKTIPNGPGGYARGVGVVSSRQTSAAPIAPGRALSPLLGARPALPSRRVTDRRLRPPHPGRDHEAELGGGGRAPTRRDPRGPPPARASHEARPASLTRGANLCPATTAGRWTCAFPRPKTKRDQKAGPIRPESGCASRDPATRHRGLSREGDRVEDSSPTRAE